MSYRIGSNVHYQGSVHDTMISAEYCKCIQFFLGGNICKKIPTLTEEDVAMTNKLCKVTGMGLYVHSQYCINLGPPIDDDVVLKWTPVLEKLLEETSRIPCSVILHMGSGSISRRVEGTPENFHTNVMNAIRGCERRSRPNILIENMCGKGTQMGCTWDGMRKVFECFDNPKRDGIGLCFDTCHGYAAGLSRFSTHEEVTDVFEKADEVIDGGIYMIHLNDSKDKFGSGVDHHGSIGSNIWCTKESKEEGLKTLLDISRERSVDLIFETPDPKSDMVELWKLTGQDRLVKSSNF